MTHRPLIAQPLIHQLGAPLPRILARISDEPTDLGLPAIDRPERQVAGQLLIAPPLQHLVKGPLRQVTPRGRPQGHHVVPDTLIGHPHRLPVKREYFPSNGNSASRLEEHQEPSHTTRFLPPDQPPLPSRDPRASAKPARDPKLLTAERVLRDPF